MTNEGISNAGELLDSVLGSETLHLEQKLNVRLAGLAVSQVVCPKSC